MRNIIRRVIVREGGTYDIQEQHDDGGWETTHRGMRDNTILKYLTEELQAAVLTPEEVES